MQEWRRQWHPTPVLLPGKSHGWRSLVGCSPWGRSRLSDFTFTFHFHALEKEMATHCSGLAWRIPGTAEPGGLPSMGLHSRTRLKWLSSSSSSQCRRQRFHPWVRKIPWRRKWQPTIVFSCLGNLMNRGAWQATVQVGVTKELDTTYQLNNNNIY